MSLTNSLIRKWQRRSLLVLGLLLIAGPVAAQTEIALYNVDGETAPGVVHSESPIIFHIRYGNLSPGFVMGFSNGFRVYSPDGAVWPSLEAVGIDLSPWILEIVPNTMVSGDTIGYREWGGEFPVMYNGFNGVVLEITVGPISSAHVGQTICLDSTVHPVTGSWVWSVYDVGDIFPDWGGPYCYTIDDCCVGVRGDVNGDGADMDIVDLTCLVDWLFGSGCEMPCQEEADANGDGSVDIVDFTDNVDYLWGVPPTPIPCP